MEKSTKYFKYCYENDTAVEYVRTGVYTMLNCSYTSEDPDYGTDTIHFTMKQDVSMERIAYEMLGEVKDFLDYREGAIEASRADAQNNYDDYSNSTLIAIEYALSDITKDYSPKKRYATIWDASEWIARKLLADRTKTFSFCESDSIEAKGDPEKHKDDGGWHGIKRIDGFFDNVPDEFIIAVGHYGGGNAGFGYLDFGADNLNEYARVIRGAICQATGWNTDNMIYIEEEEEK